MARPKPRLRALAVIALSAAFVALGLSACSPRGSASPSFAEEFSGTGLDTSKWEVGTPWHTQYVTGGLAWYQPQNVVFPGGGICRIVTDRQTVHGTEAGTFEYTSGSLTTGADHGGKTRFSFTYGYLEMRAKLPQGKGIWPAFWLTDDRTFEIDVMEMIGRNPRRVYMSLHDNNPGSESDASESYEGPDFSGGYHTFGVDWQRSYVRVYVDGVQRAEFTHHIPDQPMWIVVDTAVGGDWPGAPDESTHFPQHFDIDYIRLWHDRRDAVGGTATVPRP